MKNGGIRERQGADRGHREWGGCHPLATPLDGAHAARAVPVGGPRASLDAEGFEGEHAAGEGSEEHAYGSTCHV
jgi:hypothetical protein